MEVSKQQNPTNSVLLEIPLIFGIRAACRNFIFNLQMELKQNKSSSFHLIQNDDQDLNLAPSKPWKAYWL